MADQPENKNPKDSKQSLDLNQLSGLDFGPNWAAERAKPGSRKDYASSGKGGYDGGKGSVGGPRSGGAARDRRSGGARPPRNDAAANRNGPRGARGEFGRGNAAPAQFEPTVKVDLYPQDEAFDALISRLRSSARTYQLFDIAQLLLEKPDRFVVVVAPLPSKQDAPAMLYFSVPGHIPFESEEAAVSFVVSNHLDQYFDIEEIEIDPPKGNFQMVNRCTITGKLLGPPNYHRYQEFLRHHYANEINGMSFERFTSKIEGVKEPEQIEAWLESMKKGARYIVKDRQEGEPESLESPEAARHFLLQHRKDRVVGSGESVRFAGRDIERLPRGDIRRSVETYIEKQKTFPLESANNIRGRLRRHKFAVYKKGSKGVSFVCAVKRKFRDSKTVFTDSIGNLIEFIEKHPEMPASKLPKAYIGIDTEKQKPETLKMTEAEVEAAAKAKAEAATSETATEAKETPPAGSESTGGTDVQQDKPDSEISANAREVPDASGETEKKPAPAVAEDAKASTEAKPKMELTEAESKKLRQLMGDLRWLITEGYVTEYGDGRLFAPPPMPEAKPKPPSPVKVKEDAGETEPTKSSEPSKAVAAGESVNSADTAESAEVSEPTSASEPTEGGESAASEKKSEGFPK